MCFQEHEKSCRRTDFESDDDDVIFCGEEEQEPEDKSQMQLNFLQNFQLFNNTIPLDQQVQLKSQTPHKRNSTNPAIASSGSSYNNNNTIFNNKNSCSRNLDVPLKPDKVRRPPRRTQSALLLSKCPVIPIASPAGQHLLKTLNAPLAENYQRERIDRYERFCSAPTIAFDGSNRPKFMDKKFGTYNISTFRSNSKCFHIYKFPRRQFCTRLRDEAVAKYQQILIKQNKCKPLSVTADRLSKEDIEELQTKVKRRKISTQSNANSKIIDFIDLCSSDAESDAASESDDETDSKDSHSMSDSSSSTQSIKNVPLFVDCSTQDENESLLYGSDNIDSPNSNTIVRTHCDTTSTLIGNTKIRLITTRRKSLNLYQNNQMQQDKENHLYPFIDAPSSPQSTTYLYENGIDDMNSTISSTNLISIDLTL